MALYEVNGGVSGTVNVDANKWVVGISAYAEDGVTDATVKVNDDDPVSVPAGGATNLNPPLGSLKGPTIVFTNTIGYGIETVE